MLATRDRGEEVSLWIGRTEVPWELLDAYVFERAHPQQPNATDAVARPSKPYISMDRGWGHAGYPAICVSPETAKAFCQWLSIRTGRRFRLPTVTELRSVAPVVQGQVPSERDARIWHRGNSGGTTHPVSSALPDDRGFHALRGNVAEWATEEDGTLVLWGGSFLTASEDLGGDLIQRPAPEWNASDPQMPPSRWWLADAPFAGLRLVCEPMESERAQPVPGGRPMDARDPSKEKTP